MSWAEIKKINSDMSEPLNYTHYIYDISAAKENSYVLNLVNAYLWDELCLNSRYLYSNKAVQDIVYNRLTNENIDNLFNKSGILGEQLNCTHNLTELPMGNATNFCKTVTRSNLDKLRQKFKEGYDRYVTSKIDNEKCGEWLNSTFSFNSDDMKKQTKIEDIVVNDTLFNLILNNESAFMAVTNVARGVQAIVNSAKALEIIASQINNVSNNEIVIKAILEKPELFNSILNNEAIITSISNSEVGIKAILRNLDGFKALIDNQTALTTALKSQVTINAVTKAMEECLNAEVILDTTKNNLNVIKENLPKLVDGIYISDDIINTQTNITATKDKIVGITSKTDVLIANVNGLINNTAAMNVVVNNLTAMTAIVNNLTIMTEIINNKNLAKIILSSSVARTALSNNVISFNMIYSDLITQDSELSILAVSDELVNGLVKLADKDVTQALRYNKLIETLLDKATEDITKITKSNVSSNVTQFMNTVLGDIDLCWKLNSKDICKNKANFAIEFNTTNKTSTRTGSSSNSCTKFYTNKGKGVYMVNGTGEIYTHDKVEICKLTNGSYTGTYGVNSYQGYYNVGDKPSVLVESADRVVFCCATETVWQHSDNSDASAAYLYFTEIK